jgi:tetratricopeptide (TPR) repeat protein
LIDDLPRKCNVVLDDLLFEPGAVREWEEVFAGLIYTVKARQISVITTSRKNVPSRVRNLLGSLIPSEVLVPDFDKHEVEQLCVQLGCLATQVETQAKVAYLHTSGHPQLVHARLITLSRQGWPTVSVDSLLKTPEDVREQQQQARQLLDALAPEEADLLYRASVALAPFRREHIVLLGENANLPRPGDLFDRLVGPWIERATGDRFELSPLLRNAGTEVWSRSTIEVIHSQLADAILTANDLSITDGSHALFHAFVGKNKQALTGLGISLATQASEEVQKALGESAFWFLGMRVEEENGPIFEGDQPLSLLLRMMQFRLCVAAEPEKAPRVLDAWEREIAQLDQSPGSLLSKMLFYIIGLLHVEAPIPLRRVVRLFKEFAAVRQAIITSGDRELFDSLPLTQIDREGEAVNLLATLFGINGMRCRSRQDLDECLQSLSELAGELRQELLEAFNMPEGYASVYVDSVYLNEFKTEKPDWNACLSVLSKAMDCATKWKSSSLGASAARAFSIILDEHLDRHDDALAILDEGAERFPSDSWILEEHRGTILLHGERYDEAVEVFARALKGRDDGRLGFLRDPFFEFRNAGIAAARADRWGLAAEFFRRGHNCAVALDNPVFAAAFQTDAAYAFWEAGRHQEMLESFRSSIALIDAMGRSKEGDLGQFWVFRITAHTLNWIRHVVEDGQPLPGLAKPFAGMCSNPERNEEILKLPDVHFELTLYFLIRLERALKADPLALSLYGPRLDEMRLPAVAMFMSELWIREAFESGSLGRLPDLVDRLVRAYVASKSLVSEGKPPWSTAEQPVSEDQVKQTLLDEDFLEGPFLAALLQTCQMVTSGICPGFVEQWRSSAAALPWAEDLARYLDSAEALSCSSVTELQTVLRSNEASPRDRQLAALFLAQRPSDVGFPDLLQAHVFLLDRFSQLNFLGQYVEKALSEMIASAWVQKAHARFALRTPNITGPALEAACSMVPECFGKSAAVLIAAADAAGIRLPQPLAVRYRQLRDGIAERART